MTESVTGFRDRLKFGYTLKGNPRFGAALSAHERFTSQKANQTAKQKSELW